MYLFLERGEGRDKDRERNIDQSLLVCAPMGNQTHNPGACLDRESKRQPFTLQNDTETYCPDKISISVSRLVSLYDLQETFSDMEFSDQTGILTLIDNAKLPSGNITSINSTMSV